MGLLGIIILLGIAYIFSTSRKHIYPRMVASGLFLQLLFGVVVLDKGLAGYGALFLFAALIMVFCVRKFLEQMPMWRYWWLRGSFLLAVMMVHMAVSRLVSLPVAVWQGITTTLACLLLIHLFILQTTQGGKKLLSKVDNALSPCHMNLGSLLTVLLVFFGVLSATSQNLMGADLMRSAADAVTTFLNFANAGSEFLFGSLGLPTGSNGFIFAFQVLPTIIFFASFMSVLYYIGIMQSIVTVISDFMQWIMGTGGPETLSVASNIFVGQTEAPLLIKPYLSHMTDSELVAVMTGGFATIAGGVMAGYIQMGASALYLMSASIMNAPAALVMAKMFCPETTEKSSQDQADKSVDVRIEDATGGANNILDATVIGALDGMHLATNVAAMLIAFISLIALVGAMYGSLAESVNSLLGLNLTTDFNQAMGILAAPFAFILGVPWSEAPLVGNLLAYKILVNEYVGYVNLVQYMEQGLLSERSIMVATFALCGFANLGSLGIQVGGIGALAPDKRSTLSRLVMRAMIAGFFASCISAALAALLF